jgi:hypothetical protein
MEIVESIAPLISKAMCYPERNKYVINLVSLADVWSVVQDTGSKTIVSIPIMTANPRLLST